MIRKTILMSAPLGLGVLGLLWAATAFRSAPDPEPGRPRPLPKAAERPVRTRDLVEPVSTRTSLLPAAAPSSGGVDDVIQQRIRTLEERLLTLETRRIALADGNQELERQVIEKHAGILARTMAEVRVRGWEQLLGLSETQKQSLLDLCQSWEAGRTAGREPWLSREAELRARLSVEQAALLHDTAVAQSQQLWSHLARSIGGMVGATKDESVRFQQLLGDYAPPATMLLPEAYGADWPGMVREGSNRLQSVLSPDQLTKFNRFAPKQER